MSGRVDKWERIRKLRRLAADPGAFPGEAANATTLADRLQAQAGPEPARFKHYRPEHITRNPVTVWYVDHMGTVAPSRTARDVVRRNK
jgi:hypothetical protein